ncbi:unnamed protein product [Ceutorhynchus assimilis]|uniref:alpha-glucosidase n=1 Tax=Ceutorhynchus assimilis TaxID=467358 RepID=A0A9N9QCG4_9CUCU|nr:unnamed protein product [Ceutorhynchus assimilis]
MKSPEKLSVFIFILLNMNNKVSSKNTDEGDKQWYKTSTLYQVYPRSLKDSNGDGIGDLRGVIQKLNLFVDAGITAFWLSPIFKSPQVDQGYDVSDYYTVEPDYGTNEDLYELIQLSHEAGIKVLLDFVPNHTSDQHGWFNKSIHREDGYDDFYIWADGVVDSNGERQPPNNWLSLFGGSAWEWNQIRQQYYFHQFTVQQPELNYRSQGMVNALKDVMQFWLDKGIDGFRVDAVPYLVEDAKLTNEPVKDIAGCSSTIYTCLDHIYTKDQQGSFEAVYDFRDFVENYTDTVGGDQRIIVTEAYSPRNITLLYYGNSDGSRLGAHYTFNFDFIQYLNFDSSASDIANIINWWQENLNTSWIRNWVMGNHDNHRVATRLGYPDAYNMLVDGFLPGVSVTYQGEEIAMENGEVDCTQGKDPKANCSNFESVSRDFERTPFQWDFSKNAGFSDANETWLPVSSKYLSNNLAAQNVTGLKSHYNLYKDCIKFHKKLSEESAKVQFQELNTFRSHTQGDVLITYRMFNTSCGHDDPYVLLFNMNRVEVASVDLIVNVVKSYQVEVTWLQSKYQVGEKISSKEIHLFPQESIILKAQCDQKYME